MQTIEKIKWGVNSKKSYLGFKVKHFLVTSVIGHFKDFRGHIESKTGNFDRAKVFLTIESNSVDTQIPARDNYLKSEKFFDTTWHAHILFEGRLYKKINNKYLLKGILNIKGVSKKVVLEVFLRESTIGENGKNWTIFELRGSINRKAFGLHLSEVAEKIGVVVSEEVKLEMNIQLEKK